MTFIRIDYFLKLFLMALLKQNYFILFYLLEFSLNLNVIRLYYFPYLNRPLLFPLEFKESPIGFNDILLVVKFQLLFVFFVLAAQLLIYGFLLKKVIRSARLTRPLFWALELPVLRSNHWGHSQPLDRSQKTRWLERTAF